MTGVTIGIGEVFLPLAKLAAACVKEMCGLDVVILSESHLLKCGLGHPTALKFKMFDLINDDQLFYFDADWFCVKPWDVAGSLSGPDLFACRDFVLLDDWPGQYFNDKGDNAIQLDFQNPRNDYVEEMQAFMNTVNHWSTWINTGLFKINRESHEFLSDQALKNYLTFPGHHSQYYEQPALNLAIEQTAVNVQYLEREKNILVASRKQWPPGVTGLHVKLKRHEDFVKQVMEKRISCAQDVRNYFILQI